ncbi:MAG TPA: prepilin peptidase [Bacillaceae bacterium]
MAIIIFIYALLLGSFLNVVGLRVPLNQSIVHPRSRCPGCRRELRPIELIPVVSYLLLQGCCSACGSRISPLYPSVELASGLLFMLAWVRSGWSVETLIAWTFISMLLIIIVTDIQYMLIPDKILLFFAGVFLTERLLLPLNPWWDSLFGAGTGFALLLLIAVASKGGMGGGDIKLFAVIGFVYGLQFVLLAFFLSSMLGALFGLLGMAAGLVEKGKPIPFGPYIAAGSLLAYFYHQPILDWYFSFY